MEEVNKHAEVIQEIEKSTGVTVSEAQMKTLMNAMKWSKLTAHKVSRVLRADSPELSFKGKAKVIAGIINTFRDQLIDVCEDTEETSEVAEQSAPSEQPESIVVSGTSSKIASSPKTPLESAEEAFVQSEYELALVRYRRIGKKIGMETVAHIGMARCYEQLGNITNALEYFRIAADFDVYKTHPEIQGNIARLEGVKDAIPDRTSEKQEWLKRGEKCMAAGSYLQALNCFRNAQKIDRNDPMLLEKIGDAYRAEDLLSRAAYSYYEAFIGHKQRGGDTSALAHSLIELTDTLLAKNDSKENILNYYRMRIDAYDSLNMHAEEIENIRRFLALDETDAVYHNYLAWQLATLPYPEYVDGGEAVDHGWKALQYGGASYFNLDTLAAAFARKGEYDMAISFQERALKLLKALTPDERVEQNISDEEILMAEERLQLFKEKKPYTAEAE